MTPRRFAQLVRPVEGLRVSRVWRGHGSAVFLELGASTLERGLRRPKGEATVMIEWSWRIEGTRAIRAGSGSSDRRIKDALAALKGRRVRRVRLEGRLPELNVELTGGTWLRSFVTVEPQPEWVLFLPDRSWLCVEQGRVVRKSRLHARDRR